MPPPTPPWPQHAHTTPASHPKKKKRWPWIVGGGIAAMLLLCIGIGAIAAGAPQPKGSGGSPLTATKPAAPAAPVEAPKTYATPTAASFKATVKVLKKNCFGSAGCNITYRIDPAYTGAPLDPSVTWMVTYEIQGVESGPAVNTFTVTGDQANFSSEELGQTASQNVKLTVKVTDVARQ